MSYHQTYGSPGYNSYKTYQNPVPSYASNQIPQSASTQSSTYSQSADPERIKIMEQKFLTEYKTKQANMEEKAQLCKATIETTGINKQLLTTVLVAILEDEEIAERQQLLQQVIGYGSELAPTQLDYVFTEENSLKRLFDPVQEFDEIAILVQESKQSIKSRYSKIGSQYTTQTYTVPIQRILAKQVDQKISTFKSSKELERKCFTEPFEAFMSAKETQQRDRIPKPEKLEECRQKITFFYREVIEYLQQYLLNLHMLLHTLVQWVMLFDGSRDSDFAIVNSLCATIKSACQDQPGYSNAKYQVEHVQDLVNYVLDCYKIREDENDLIKCSANLFYILQQFPNTIMEELMQMYYVGVMYNQYCVEDVLVMLPNMIAYSYTPSTVQLIYYLSVRYRTDSRYDILLRIYEQFVQRRLMNKLRVRVVFKDTLQLLRFYIFGFQQMVPLTVEAFKQLLDTRHFITLMDYTQVRDFCEFLQAILKTSSLIVQLPQALIEEAQKILASQSKDCLQLTDKVYENLYRSGVFSHDQQPLAPGLINQLREQFAERRIGDFSLIENLGNTCYMDSFVIALFMTKNFRRIVLDQGQALHPQRLACDRRDALVLLMQIFYKILKSFQVQTINPREFKESLPEPFRSSQEQQDAGEFGKIYLDFLENIFMAQQQQLQPHASNVTTNLVQQLFFGQLDSLIQCRRCQKVQHKVEKVGEIGLNIALEAWEEKFRHYDMIKMLQNYFHPTDLVGDNLYFCEEGCRGYCAATKWAVPEKFPPYLILTINRFQQDFQKQEVVKRIEPVHINFEFKLSEVFGTLITQIQDDETYELYAFIVHQGTSANSGHYFTYARDLDSDPDSWHYFDDNLAGTPVPVFKASSYDDLKKDWSEFETVYMLFYARKTRQTEPFDFTHLKRYSDFKNQTPSQPQHRFDGATPTGQDAYSTPGGPSMTQSQSKKNGSKFTNG